MSEMRDSKKGNAPYYQLQEFRKKLFSSMLSAKRKSQK